MLIKLAIEEDWDSFLDYMFQNKIGFTDIDNLSKHSFNFKDHFNRRSDIKIKEKFEHKGEYYGNLIAFSVFCGSVNCLKFLVHKLPSETRFDKISVKNNKISEI